MALLALYASPESAWAANECGAVAPGATVTCDTSLNPYNGITYSVTGITLNVDTGVVNNTVGDITHGFNIYDNGPTPGLTGNFANGVSISTSGENAHGIKFTSDGSITIDSGADISVNEPLAAPIDTSGSYALIGEIRNSAVAPATINITQRAGSHIQANGPETAGIYGLHDGIDGDVQIRTAGRITLTQSDYGNGVLGWIADAASNGAVTLIQDAGSEISVTGDASTGFYALNSGLGASSITANGRTVVNGTGSGGAFLYIPNANNAADASISIGSSAELTTNNGADAAMILNSGLGNNTITTSGKLTVTGNNGIAAAWIRVDNAASNGSITITATDTSVSTTEGDNTSGLYARNFGLGATAISSAGEVQTGGDGAAGIFADSRNANNTQSISLQQLSGPTSRITTQGANAYGMHAKHDGTGEVSVVANGTVQTNGVNAHGLFAQTTNAASGSQALARLDASGVISTSGDGAHAINVTHAGTGAASGTVSGDALTGGDGAYGLNVTNSNVTGNSAVTATVNAGGTLRTTGDGAHGVVAMHDGLGNVRVQTGGQVNTTGDGSRGIYSRITNAASSGQMDVTLNAGSQVRTQGANSQAVYALNDGTGNTNITTGTEVRTAGANAHALHARNTNANATGQVAVTVSRTAGIVTQGDGAYGVLAQQSGNGNALVENRASVTTAGDNANAIHAEIDNAAGNGRAAVSVRERASATTTGNAAHGVVVRQQGLGQALAESAGTIRTSGEQANGIRAEITSAGNTNDVAITLDQGSTVRTDGNRASAAYAGHAGNGGALLKLAGSVTTSGQRSHGLQTAVTSATGNGRSEIEIENGATIRTSGRSAHGAFASHSGSGTSAIDLRGNADVQASGQYAAGLAVQSANGDARTSIAANAIVTGGWQATANGTGTGNISAAAIAIGSPTSSTIVNRGTLGAGSDRVVVDTGRYSNTAGNATIDNYGTMTGYVELAPDGTNVMVNRSNGTLVLRHSADTDGDGQRDTRRVAISDFGSNTSRFENEAGATLRVDAGDNVANVSRAGFYQPGTGIDGRVLSSRAYTMRRNGITQAQMVNLGEFRHAGTIDLRGASVGNTLVLTGAASANGGAGSGKYVANGGSLLLNAGPVTPSGKTNYADMLIVDATEVGPGGATRIFVTPTTDLSAKPTTGNGIQVVEVRDKARSDSGAFTLGEPVGSGAYRLSLRRGGLNGDADDGNWYLRNTVTVVDPEPPVVDPEPPVVTPEPPTVELPDIRDEVPTVMAVPALAYRLGADVLGTYHDRAGEDYVMRGKGNLREGYTLGEEEESRAWGRVFGSDGKSRFGGKNELARYRTFRHHGPRYEFEVSGVQLGWDLLRDLDEDGSRTMAGAYVAATHARADVSAVLAGRAGRVTMDGYTLGGYWTLMGKSRWYVDAVAQATWYYDIEAKAIGGQTIRPDGWGMAASLEGGYPFALNDEWTFEPQAQVIYQHVKLDRTERDRFGIFKFDNTDVIYTRIGARLARHWEDEEGREKSAWLRANLWHVPGKQAHTTVSALNGSNPVRFGTELGGSWMQLGAGFNCELRKDLNAFAAIDYNYGLSRSQGNSIAGRIGLQLVW